MSLDDIDLYQVRTSLVNMRKSAFARFEGMEPLELAVYFSTGSSEHPYDFVDRDLNFLQHLVNFYVETTHPDFQREFRELLHEDIRPDKMYEEEQPFSEMAKNFTSDIVETIRFYENWGIEHLREGDRSYIVDEEITEEEYYSSVNRHTTLIFSNSLGFRDDLGIHGLAERVYMEKEKVGSEMSRKIQRSGRKS